MKQTFGLVPVLAFILIWPLNPVFAGCVVGINPDGSTAPCSDGGSSGGGSPGGGGGFRKRGPSPEEIHRQEQKRHNEQAEKTFQPILERYYREAREAELANQKGKAAHLSEQQARYQEAAFNNEMGNNWNEAGISAFQSGSPSEALTHFKKARHYLPQDTGIMDNISKSISALYYQTQDYMKSLNTALAIKSISPNLLLFHPHPGVRMEAQKQLAKESMKKIVAASAGLVINTQLNRGKVKPFSWESPQQIDLRRQLAKEHSDWVERLHQEALQEIPDEVKTALEKNQNEPGRAMKITPGPATAQLLKLGFRGFD